MEQQITNPLEIYKILPRSNCKQCQAPTCLAFADAVIKGQKGLDDCPYLENDTIERFQGKIVKKTSLEEQQEQMLEEMKKEISKVDLSTAAERLGAEYFEGEQKLHIKVLGKNYTVDTGGNIASDCHVITWVTIPLISYILNCKGRAPTGRWVPFRELPNGSERQPLFGQRCEKTLKEIADTHVDLLFDFVITVFGGRPLDSDDSSDYSLVLYPLPKVPVLISYQSEGDRYTRINMLFDEVTEDNLDIESVFMLGVGLVTMFQNIVHKHG